MRKLFGPVTKSLEKTSQDITKAITESFSNNNKAIENLSNKLLDNMNDRGILANYLMSPFYKITNPENTTQFKLVKDSSSKGVNDLIIHNSIAFTLHDNLLTFPDTNKVFELKMDLLKMITNKNYNVGLASLSDKKLMYDFAKEMTFDTKAQCNKSTRDRTLLKLLNSRGLMVFASGVSKPIFLSSDPDDLRKRLKLLLQAKKTGNISDINNNEIIAIVDKLLEYKTEMHI